MAPSKSRNVVRKRRAGKGGTARKVKLVIKGDVQDVGFRLRLLSEAQRLSLPEFFADNLPDGRTVVVYVGGKAESVDGFVGSVKRIKGDVQEVGFRLRLLSEAQRLSLPEFFADNLPDGRTVVVYVGGKTESVDGFVDSVKRIKMRNPGVVGVAVEPYEGDIRAIGDYVDYLHTEQLSKGVEAIQTLGRTLKEAAGEFAESVASGFSRMDERFDEMPRKVADEIGRR